MACSRGRDLVVSERTWTVSVSQWEKFSHPQDGCERKWAFGAYGGGEYVQSLSALRGDLGHAGIRAWGQHGVPPERHAQAWAERIDREHAASLAEKNISASDYAQRIVDVVNKMTPMLDRPKWPSTHVCEWKSKIRIDDVPWVVKPDLQTMHEHVDYKFLWSANEAKSEADLYVDPQANLYTYAWFLANPGADKRAFRHVVGIPGKSAKALQVGPVYITRDDATRRVSELNEHGKRIYRLALEQPDPLTLPPNWNACEAYGGCAYFKKCKPRLEDVVNICDSKQHTEKKPMGSLLDQLTKGSAPAAPKTDTKPAAASVPEVKTQEASKPSESTPNESSEALAKAKKMIGLCIEVHEVVNGLKAMFPKFSLDELGEIVSLARATTPAKVVDASPVPVSLTASIEKTDEKEGPAKRGRPAKTDPAGNVRDAVLALIESAAKGASLETPVAQAQIANLLATAIKGL